MVGNLLEVEDLCVDFSTPTGIVHAVRSVSFAIGSGEIVGLVGESGSGKSVTSLSIMRLLAAPPGKVASGFIRFEGQDLLMLSSREMQTIRGSQISMVFQDPFSCLNPTMTLGDQVIEAIRAHSSVTKAEARKKALDLFRSVRIPEPEIRLRQYPHQISGGQRQRVMIAIAFCTQPKLLIADEPTTALDVTVQAQILALLRELQRDFGTAIVMISHDLGVVAGLCDQVMVLYGGRVMEQSHAQHIFHHATHPYTLGLLRATARMDRDDASLLAIPGAPPNMAKPPTGCPFSERCALADAQCHSTVPPLTPLNDKFNTLRACHKAAASVQQHVLDEATHV